MVTIPMVSEGPLGYPSGSSNISVSLAMLLLQASEVHSWILLHAFVLVQKYFVTASALPALAIHPALLPLSGGRGRKFR